MIRPATFGLQLNTLRVKPVDALTTAIAKWGADKVDILNVVNSDDSDRFVGQWISSNLMSTGAIAFVQARASEGRGGWGWHVDEDTCYGWAFHPAINEVDFGAMVNHPPKDENPKVYY